MSFPFSLPRVAVVAMLAFTFCGAHAEETLVVDEGFEPTFNARGWDIVGDDDVSPRRLIAMGGAKHGSGAIELTREGASRLLRRFETPIDHGWAAVWVRTGRDARGEVVLSGAGGPGFTFAMDCTAAAGTPVFTVGGEMLLLPPDRVPDVLDGWHQVVVAREGARVDVFFDGVTLARVETAGPAWDALELGVADDCSGDRARFDRTMVGLGDVPDDLADFDRTILGEPDYGPSYTAIDVSFGLGRLSASESNDNPVSAAGFPVSPLSFDLRLSRRGGRGNAIGVRVGALAHDQIDRLLMAGAEFVRFDPSRRFFGGVMLGFASLSSGGPLGPGIEGRETGFVASIMAGLERPVGAQARLGLRLEAQYHDAGPFESMTNVLAGVHVGYDLRR